MIRIRKYCLIILFLWVNLNIYGQIPDKLVNDKFSFPYKIIKDKEGSYYVSDSGNGVIKKYSNSSCEDIGKGLLNFPTGIAIYKDILFVTEPRLNIIRCYNLMKETWTELELDEKLSNPRDIIIINNYLFIVDSGNHRILEFEIMDDGKLELVSLDFKNMELRYPVSFALNKKNNDMYVACWGMTEVIKFDFEGKYCNNFALLDSTKASDKIYSPIYLSIEYVKVNNMNNCNIYVIYDVEPKNSISRNVIVKFDSNGNNPKIINKELLSSSFLLEEYNAEKYFLLPQLKLDHPIEVIKLQ